MNGWISLPGSDAAHVRRALRDDPRAFEALVLRYQRRAHAIARAIGVPSGAVEDVIQESFLKAFENLPHLRSPESFGPWLLAIVRNAARRNLRERKRTAEPLGDVPAAPAPDSTEDREFKDLLWRKVAALPEPIREAIFLYYHEGESPRAVAQAQGISRGAVLKRLQRGRDLLREELWRELEESIRDLLPSAREWKQKGRQLTILVLGAVATSWGIRTAPAVAGTAAAGKGAAALGTLVEQGAVKALVMGGLQMTMKNVAVALGVTVLAVVGTLLFIIRAPAPDRGDLASAPEAPNRRAERVALNGGPAKKEASREGGRVTGRKEAGEKTSPPPPFSIAGRISSRAGQGISGARVLVLPVREWDLLVARFGVTVWTLGDGSLSPEMRELFQEYRSRAEKLPRSISLADGSYRIEGLEEGEHRVIASHEEYLPRTDGSAWVVPGGPARCDLQLDEGRPIAGRVRDEQGRPVAGALIAARPSSARRMRRDDRKEEMLSALQGGRSLIEEPRATSDNSGAFRLRPFEPEAYDLTVTKDGFAEARRLDVPAGEEALDLVLSSGFSLIGHLVDPEKSPVEGAEATLEALRGERPRPTAVGEVLYEDETPEDPALERAPLRSQTGPEGRFEFRGLNAGQYHLVLRAGEHPPIEKQINIAGASIDLGTLVLESVRSITGRVLGPRGGPAADAVVWIEDPPRGGVPVWAGRAFVPRKRCEVRADPRGNFLLPGLPQGLYTLRASSRDLAPGVVPNVASGTEDVEVRLAAGREVRGRVLDGQDRAPIGGAEVSLSFAGESSEAIPGKTSVSGSDGSFVIRGAPQDDRPLQLRASHPHYGGRPRQVELERQYLGEPVEILFFPAERISGRVIDAQGEPVAGARVALGVQGWKMLYVLRDLATASPSALSGPDGAFSLEVPRTLRNPNILLEIAAYRAGVGAGRSSPIRPEEKVPWPEVEVTIKGCGFLSGKVMDLEGKPVSGAAVRASRILSGDEHQRTLGEARTGYSGRDGSYTIGDLEPGTFDIEVTCVGYSREWVEDVEVGEGPRAQDVALDRGIDLEGRVVESSGEEVSGAEVFALLTEASDLDVTERTGRIRNLRQREHPGIASARTGGDGRYRLSNLPRRSVTVVARAPGFAPSALQVVQPGEAPAELFITRVSSVAGTVSDAATARAISLFQVSAFKQTEGGGGWRERTLIPRDYDDPRGEFLLEGLEPGRYLLAVKAAGYALWHREIELDAGGSAVVDANLEIGKTLRGVVRDLGSGQGIPGVTVRVSGKDQRLGVMIPMLSAWSGEDGEFAVPGIEPGPATVHVFHSYFAAEKNNFPVKIEEGEPSPLEIGMFRAGRLEGRIANLKPERMLDTRVLLKRPGGEKAPDLYGPVRPDGRYQVSSIPPGTYDAVLRELVPDPALDLTKAGTSFNYRDLKERFTPLGTVEIRAGETAMLDGRAQ